jgi:peptidoglycan/xylan/chitin deacetylase (PgdA/CDA1 family)
MKNALLLLAGGMLAIGITAASASAQEVRRVAFTFDDVPATALAHGSCDANRLARFTKTLIEQLVDLEVPATAFVTESRVCEPLRASLSTKLLSLWSDAGFELANHSFSHFDLNTTPVEAYIADIERGADTARAVSDAASAPFRYFRHPYLHAGDTLEKKHAVEAFLSSAGYEIGVVTIDNQEWVFADVYKHALEDGDAARGERILEAYVDYMNDVFAFFEVWSVDVVGYEPPQVLLLHANELNVRALPKLTAMLQDRGYEFISLEEALSDPAYASSDSYVGPRGLSWLHRWALAKGMELREEPREPDWIAELRAQR